MYKYLELSSDIKNIIGSYNGLTNDELKENKNELLNQLNSINRIKMNLEKDRKIILKQKLFIKLYTGTEHIQKKYQYIDNDEMKLVDWKEPFNKLKYPNINISPRTTHKIIKNDNKEVTKHRKLQFIQYYIEKLPESKIKKYLNWLSTEYEYYENEYDRDHEPSHLCKYGYGKSKI